MNKEEFVEIKKDIYDLKQVIKFLIVRNERHLSEAERMVLEASLKRLNITR
jgi:hypothetical protein